MVKKSQPGLSKTADVAALAAAQAAARHTDSGPTKPAPPAAAKGDLPARKGVETQALAAAQPHNANKAAEYAGADGNAIPEPPRGQTTPPSPSAMGSTLSEQNINAQVGAAATPGHNPLVAPLEGTRVDGSGQRLTTNQGVPVAHNQHSLKAGARGPALLAQTDRPLTLPDGQPDPGLIPSDVSDLDTHAAEFMAAIATHRHFERDQDPPRV